MVIGFIPLFRATIGFGTAHEVDFPVENVGHFQGNYGLVFQETIGRLHRPKQAMPVETGHISCTIDINQVGYQTELPRFHGRFQAIETPYRIGIVGRSHRVAIAVIIVFDVRTNDPVLAFIGHFQLIRERKAMNGVELKRPAEVFGEQIAVTFRPLHSHVVVHPPVNAEALVVIQTCFIAVSTPHIHGFGTVNARGIVIRKGRGQRIDRVLVVDRKQEIELLPWEHSMVFQAE